MRPALSFPALGWLAGALVLGACTATGRPPAVSDDAAVEDDATQVGPGTDAPSIDAPPALDTPPALDALDAPPPSRCAADTDCARDPGGRICDLAAGRCVQCLPARDTCPPAQHCDEASRACVAGCRSDEGCAPGTTGDDAAVRAQRCDPSTHACVDCLRDEHCPAGMLCVGRACARGCSATRPCAGGELCCSGACIDPRTNVAHCGRCDAPCATRNGEAACVDGVCTVGRCTGPHADCDRVASNGCEADTATDVAHCGACERRCPEPFRGAPACVTGVCGVRCEAGRGDCNGVAADGCEVDLATEPAHCGRCGRACAPPPHAVASCVEGTCGRGVCDLGYADCDGDPANGCETDTRTAAEHCGACGRPCAAPNGMAVCEGGVCRVRGCRGGFDDCDLVPANGCETDTRVDVNHCGMCRRACPVTATGTVVCVMGACAIGTCAPGLADCDRDPGNGCEATTADDPAHCGACGVRCPEPPGGVGTCAGGVCGLGRCRPGFGDCDGISSNGCETPTDGDVLHCGGCNRRCAAPPNATPACRASACGIGSCQPGFGNCNGVDGDGCETDTRSSVAHCGACGQRCGAGEVCQGGGCVLAPCPSGQTRCGGLCVATATDRNHCGRCDNVCPAGRGCVGGSCSCGGTCASGFSGSGSGGGSGARCHRSYTFPVIAGHTYTISTCGSYSGDPYVVVSGACSCRNDDFCGLGAQCTCTASTSGTAVLCASSYSSRSASWNYTVTSSTGCTCR